MGAKRRMSLHHADVHFERLYIHSTTTRWLQSFSGMRGRGLVRESLKLDIKPFPSGNASAGRHDQHEGKTEDECVSPSHNGGYEYSRIVPKIGHFHWSNGVGKWGGLIPFL